MIPSADIVISCPGCQAPAKYMTLLSGNTFDASYWTDGKMLAPMMPAPPPVVECHKCQEAFWLSKAKVLGKIEPLAPDSSSVSDEWKDCPYVSQPGEQAYYRAIEKGLATNPKELKYLRLHAFWRRNDAYRDDFTEQSAPEKADPKEAEENMRMLLAMMDIEDEEDRMMAAELHRELGQFTEAEELLDSIEVEELKFMKDFLLKLCEQRDHMVGKVN